MSKFAMRYYQEEGIQAAVDEYAKGCRSIIEVMPTGTGKTVLFAHLPGRMQSKRTLVLAHRDSLIRQAAEKFRTITGVAPEIEKAGEYATVSRKRINNPTVVASVSTLCQKKRLERFPVDEFDQIIIDEAHRPHEKTKTYAKIVERFKDHARIFGVTATPDRHDKIVTIGKGKFFEKCSYEYGLRTAISDGYLVPIKQKFIHVKGMSWKNVRTVRGDFDPKEIDRIVNEDGPLHKMCMPTVELIGTSPSIVFANSVNHATEVSRVLASYGKQFGAPYAGYSEFVSSISGRDDTEVVTHVTSEFTKGRLQSVVNCDLFTEGFDYDAIGFVVLMRPTKSRVKYAQMVGRGTRILNSLKIDQYEFAGDRREAISKSAKPCCTVVDFVGSGKELDLTIGVADLLARQGQDERVSRGVKRKIDSGDTRDIEDIEEEVEKELKERLDREAFDWVRADKVSYEVEEIDLFATIETLMTADQSKALKELGIELPWNANKKKAGAIISREREKQGSCVAWQRKLLYDFGMRNDVVKGMSYNQAVKLIRSRRR